MLFTMFLTGYTISNFGYGDIIFFDRFMKVSVLMLYTYLFIVITKNYHMVSGYNIIFMIVVFIPLLYSILTPLVSQRALLYHIDLFFGNFFTTGLGGALPGTTWGR